MIDAFAPVVFTFHAEQRLTERTGLTTLEATIEIRVAVLLERVKRRARALFEVATANDERRYLVARQRDGRLLVVTVVSAHLPHRVAA